MPYGHFDDDRREYVISRPDTPLPWINYLGCEGFFGLISNTAGGYCFCKDARLRRLTRFRYNNAPLDMGGRYIYVRDDNVKTGGPLFWSPTWMPTRTDLDEYECRHGMGYTLIRSAAHGIRSYLRYFVPLGGSLEIWELRLRNDRDRPAELSVFSTIEFCLWDALDDATNFQRNYSIGEVEVPGPGAHGHERGLLIHKSEYRERRNHFAYFVCSVPPVGFDTHREAFLGAYRGWDSPQAVEAGVCSGSTAHGWQPIGAHHVRIRLEAGEETAILYLLGYHENPPDAKFEPPGSQDVNRASLLSTIQRYFAPGAADAAFHALHQYWNGVLGKFTVATPDVHTNRLVNVWNPYQVMTTFNLSRSASYFESGVGRGIGFRDSSQDLLGFVHLVPERARARLLDLASTQLPSGGAWHQYQPLTKRGNSDVGSGFNDDPLWLVLAAAAYVKETDDWSILDEPVPYDNQPGSEMALQEHLERAVQFTLERLGPHDLPLIGRADWNDCLNLNSFSEAPGQSFQTAASKDGKVAESVFIAGLFMLAADELAELAARHPRALGDVHRAPLAVEDISAAASRMETAIWEAGWDGAWFRRAYDDFGSAVGSSQNEEGRIFIEPQGICVMAGLGLSDGRAQQALDSVARELATPHGIVLHQPAFSRYYLHLGEISSYPPGYKENAGVFCHTNPWIMIAETRIGRGARAHDYYLRINPSAREHVAEVHRCEPYVYAQMIAGRDAAFPGEAKNSWLTGSAAWNYVAITQWILGIRPTYDGLRIAPVFPPAWQGFEAHRSFRGVEYVIRVERSGPGNTVALELDGKSIDGDVVPLPPPGTQLVRVLARVS